MESQFRQPKQVVNVQVNKQSIARNFGIGDNEVCYAKTRQPLTRYKAIYDNVGGITVDKIAQPGGPSGSSWMTSGDYTVEGCIRLL